MKAILVVALCVAESLTEEDVAASEANEEVAVTTSDANEVKLEESPQPAAKDETPGPAQKKHYHSDKYGADPAGDPAGADTSEFSATTESDVDESGGVE